MNVLLFGGSKFMGLNFIENFIKKVETDNPKITLFVINRGNLYWDGIFFQLIKGKEFIRHYKVDRRNENEFSSVLKLIQEEGNFNKEHPFIFDFIVDFSCYKKSDLKFLLSVSFKKYIFISTDSTYNASPIALERNDDFFLQNAEGKLICEDNAVLAEDKEVRKKLKRRDSYGFEKLKCENEIQNIFLDLGSDNKYVMLRLPDVIGSFDDSYRLWYYMQWLRFSENHPVELEKVDFERKLSFVLKDDVVRTVINLIFEQNLQDEIIWNQPYNLACTENLTLHQILNLTADKLGVKFHYQVVERAHTYYPSVTFGPIDNSKSLKLLNFSPTPLFEALYQEIDFFLYVEENKDKYYQDYEDMVKDLPKMIKSEMDEK